MATVEPTTTVAISESTAADNEIVAAVAGKKIIVTSYVLVAGAAVAVTWKSGTTALSGAMSLAANGGISVDSGHAEGVLKTATGEALNLALAGAVAVAGHLTYYLGN